MLAFRDALPKEPAMTKRNRCVRAAIVIVAALAIPNVARADDNPQKLDGVWLVQSATMNEKNVVSIAWHSKLTIKDGIFVISRFCGSDRSLKGAFTLDRAATPKTVDLNVEAIDLSAMWDGVTYPKCSLPGIYTLTNDTLTLCVHTGPGQRPADFAAKSPNALTVTFMREDARFKEFPKDVTVRVVDPKGQPVVGATVFSFMMLWQDPKDKAPNPAWKYTEIAKTGPDGTARVPYEKLEMCPAMAHDAARKLTGFASVSPASLQNGTVEVNLQPTCHVRGTMISDELTKAGAAIDWTNAYLIFRGQRIGLCSVTPGAFEFDVPPGSYFVNAYGESLWGKNVEFTVPAGVADLQIPPIQLKASNLVLLKGHPAPEFEGVHGWLGDPVKLADLKGKYVLIEFWGYWCGPCVHSMPVLIKLHEEFHGKGLAIVGVHVDMGGEVDTPDKLKEKIAPIKKKLWQDRDLPFPVVLASTDRDSFNAGESARTRVSEQYGISGYPTTVLIDREGKVVGLFPARDEKDAIAEMGKLLGAVK